MRASRVAAEIVSNDSAFTIPCNHRFASRTRVQSHMSGNGGIEIGSIVGNDGNEIGSIVGIDIDGIEIGWTGWIDSFGGVVGVVGVAGIEIGWTGSIVGIDIDVIGSIDAIDIGSIDGIDIDVIGSIDAIDIGVIDAIDGIDQYGVYGSAEPDSGPE